MDSENDKIALSEEEDFIEAKRYQKLKNLDVLKLFIDSPLP